MLPGYSETVPTLLAADMVWQEACGSSLVVSSDSCLLAFVGPSGHTVTVADTASLEQVKCWGLCHEVAGAGSPRPGCMWD